MRSLLRFISLLLAVSLCLLSNSALGQYSIIEPTLVQPLVGVKDPTPFCYKNLVIDPYGRLWLKTCGVAEYLYDLQVLQFDGYDRWPISVATQEWKEHNTGHLAGASSLGFLYGFLNHNQKPPTLYTYDIQTKQLRYTPLPEGMVGGIIEYEPGRFWVLAKTKTAFTLHRWDGRQLVLRYTIPNDTHYSEDSGRYHNADRANFIYADSSFWLVDRYLPLIRFNLADQSIERYTATDFPAPINAGESSLVTAQTHLVHRGDRIFICQTGLSRHFYELTGEGTKKTIVQLPFLPPDAGAKSVWKDERGNVLFIFTYPGHDKRRHGAYLLDTDNRLFDYSPMIVGVPQIRAAIGRNFKQQAYFLSDNGAFFVQATAKSNPRAYPGLNAIRHIRQIGTDTFLVRSNNNEIRLSILANGRVAPVPEESCFNFSVELTGRKELLTDNRGQTWLRDERHLYRYSPRADGTCLSYTFDFKSIYAGFLSDERVAFIEWQTNELLIYNLRTRQRELLDAGPLRLEGVVHFMWIARDKTIWIGTNDGLYGVNSQTGAVRHYAEEAGFEDHRILVIHEDRRQRLWLGTASRGIHVFDPRQQAVTKIISVADGLSNNIVVGILEDDDGDLWAATYNGLTLLRPTGEIITVLNEEDGLTNHEFNRYAHYKAPDGRLFFGTVRGLNEIDPRQVKANLRTGEPLKIYVSRLSYFAAEEDRAVHVQNYEPGVERLVLPADKRFLNVSVGMSNYGLHMNNRYAYRLVGREHAWTYAGASHTIQLSNLPVGKYVLEIAGIDQNGNWSTNTLRIPIRAKDFFYNQPWFYVSLSIPLLVLAFLWIHRLSRERARLEREVDKRTVQIRRDKELIEQQASELQQLDAMKSRFFANISHDFRTPLTLISGPAEWIEQDETLPKTPRVKQSLQSIVQNAKKLLHLVDEILELAKLESRKIKLYEEDIALRVFCTDIFDTYRVAAQRKQLDYRMVYGPPDDFGIVADPRRLEKILHNLLGNALKFTPDGERITFRIRADHNELVFLVEDTGPGIPAADLPYIFERYFQSGQDAHTQSTGSGIGLSLAQELARLMGGTLRVKSEYGQGSTFRLALPLRETTAPRAPTAPRESTTTAAPVFERPAATQSNGQMSRVLVVEDNREVQSFLSELLQEDYRVVTRGNGVEALAFLRERDEQEAAPVDLILSDINMPRMDGYELLAALKEDESLRTLPVIMLTARVRETSKLKALRMGVDDYLTKPFSPTELLLRMRNLLANYRNRQAYRARESLVNPQFDDAISVDQNWLAELENVSLEALDKKIDLTMAYLSSRLSISERQLSRKVKLITGLTIGKYIQEIKLQKARHLLENRIVATVSEAAYRSGFKSPSYFTKVYRKYYGKNPSVDL